MLAGLIGLRAPVLLDRTLAVVAWGPLLALGFFVDDGLAARHTLVGRGDRRSLAVTDAPSMPARARHTPGPTAGARPSSRGSRAR